MNIQEYKQYAKERRSKSKIAKIYDEAIKLENLEKYGLLNGGIISDSSENPLMYFCTIGDGVIGDNGKLYTTSNMYEIQFYSGCKGVTIYKSNAISIHYRCFCCGGSPEIFGKEHFSAGCRVYEEMDVDEVLKNLVNKNWNKYHNIVHSNPYNIKFLKAMKQRLIKSLEHNKIIHWSEKQKRYVDYKYYKMFQMFH